MFNLKTLSLISFLFVSMSWGGAFLGLGGLDDEDEKQICLAMGPIKYACVVASGRDTVDKQTLKRELQGKIKKIILDKMQEVRDWYALHPGSSWRAGPIPDKNGALHMPALGLPFLSKNKQKTLLDTALQSVAFKGKVAALAIYATLYTLIKPLLDPEDLIILPDDPDPSPPNVQTKQ